MSLADEVLVEHQPYTVQNGEECLNCGRSWPCVEFRLATQLRAAERVVDWFRKNRGGTWDDLRQEADCGEGPLAEYDKEGQG